MLQWIGCGLLVIAGAGLGFYYSRRWTQRLELLKGLYQMMNLLKGEISFGSLALPDALLRIGKRIPPPLSEFAISLGTKMKSRPGEPFSSIFAGEVNKMLGNTSLTKADLEQLKELGQHLGYLDRQTQLRTLDLYTHSLEAVIQDVRQELPERKKVYQGLGIMGGLFLAVLLL